MPGASNDQQPEPTTVTAQLDLRFPSTTWHDQYGTLTNCLSCGFEGFCLVEGAANPHQCPTCQHAVSISTRTGTGHCVAAATHQGRRRVNADAAAIVEHPDGGRGWAIADGVGDDWDAADAAYLTAWTAAAAAPRVSATGALHTARQAWHEQYGHAPPGQAGTAVAVVATAMPEHLGGGHDIAWCGDARAYALNTGTLAQLTTDHTEAEQLRALNISWLPIGPDHPGHHCVTSTVRSGRIDSFRVVGDVDRLLLCTDGIYNTLTEAQIIQILTTSTDPAEAAARLAEDAGNAGRDNATAIVITTAGL